MIPIAPWQSEAHALKCELASDVLRSCGKLRLKVTGWSMLPSIWPGDVLVIGRVDPAQMSDGDIVLYRRDRRLVVHRIVRTRHQTSKGMVLTRGDAMPAPDLPVSERDLLGRVSWILRRDRCITPRPGVSVAERGIALLVRRSMIAAQLFVRAHEFLANSRAQHPTFNNRAVSCQN